MLRSLNALSVPGPDQLLGPFGELTEIVGREGGLARLESEPSHVVEDRLDEARFLGLGIGVVETEPTHAVELPGDTEVEHDRFGVTDMEVAVGLRREPGLDTAAVGAVRGMLLEHLTDEVGAGVTGGPRGRVAHPDNLLGCAAR